MKEEFNVVLDNDIKEDIDYVSLGKAMKKIRTSAGITQEKTAKIFHVSRTVYIKYETGKDCTNNGFECIFAGWNDTTD